MMTTQTIVISKYYSCFFVSNNTSIYIFFVVVDLKSKQD